jgi:protein SCO1/2
MSARIVLLLAIWALAIGAVDPNDPFSAARIDERPGAAIPLGTQFTTAAGKVTSLRDLAGDKPLLITPVQHECPNICGVTLAGLGDAIDGQERYRPGRDFAVVALGIDPREGPAEARDDIQRWRQQRSGKANWQPTALTGGKGAIRSVTDALGYFYAWDPRIGQYAHLSGTAVVTPDGRLSAWLYGLQPSPDELQRALAQATKGGTGGVMQQLLLLCFHYDPQTGRYSLAITKALRLAGLLTVLALGLLLAILARRKGGRSA